MFPSRLPPPVLAFAMILSGIRGAQGSAPAPGASDSWEDDVRASIAASEYHLSAREDGDGFAAPNRAQDLRARWHDGVVVVTPRVDGAVWSLRCELVGVGRVGRVAAAPAISWEDVSEGRIEWTRGDLREWYRNDARGIEQGFTLDARPAGDARDPLVLESLVEGLLAYPSQDDQALLLRTPAGAAALRISHLVVRDALGVELPACFDAMPGRISLLVDDAGATYPITVDPLMTSPEWTAESDQVDANLGFAVATAGDVDGDGYSDVIVGAPTWDDGEASEGGAFVYLGSASGLATTAAWSAESNQASASFGYSVATAGDVNGDGFSDVIVGARLFDNGQADEGAAFAYYGSAAGLAPAAAWTVEGAQAGARFGYSVATAGDVNGDGFADVIVGAPTYDNAQLSEGRAAVFHGSASGLATTPAWTAESNQAGAFLGYSVASAGDVNGDGYSDVIVGADAFDGGQSGEGRAFAWHGSATGLLALPAWTAECNQADAQFGYSVAGAGDVDGDGYADVIVGARWFDGGQVDEGRAFAYRGSATGLSATPAWIVEPNQPDAQLGTSVATAGDVNDDGYADVVVGAPLWDGGEMDEGAVFAYLGSAAGLAATPTWTVESNQATASFGLSVASAGDVDGDGYAEIVVGSPLFDDGASDEGRAAVFGGSAAGLAASAAWIAEGNQPGAGFGSPVAAAGDVNGDGFSDVVVGAAGFDDGEVDEGRAFVFLGSASGLASNAAWTGESDQADAGYGVAVAGAGDVDGDGYSDLIVGAPRFDDGEANEGAAFIYRGSAMGLGATASWLLEGGADGAALGACVATAGDVNGDGYSDVIVGAPDFTDTALFEGRALVYQGSASGLATIPAWFVDGGASSERLGWSVATAGDIDADGFSDVVVGAPFHDGGFPARGRALAFHGSASGLGAARWEARGEDADGMFGLAVATAGDVNGDGFSDVVIGAPYDDSGGIDAGRAQVYLGSAGGLQATAAWTADGVQAQAIFGGSVASAGDVDGDGYGDVVIGAPLHDALADAGRAFLFHGSASGLGGSPGWTADGDRAGANLGESVAQAGDVNGDGFGDVVIGADGYSAGQSDEGAALLFYGNDGGGLDRIPRQRRFDDSAPIDLLGLGDETNGFAIHARARSPFGRDRVRLEAEVRPLGTRFDGTGLLTTPFTDTGLPGGGGSFVDLSVADAPLALAPHHWRVRLHGLLPFPWWSHWMSLPGNAITETDVRAAPPRCDEPSAVDLRPIAPPLLVAKAGRPDTLSLSWEDVRAPRYDVYGGDLADLAPARPVPQQIACDILTNAGDVVVAGAGRWFVVVASCATLESSYGRDSFAVERDVAAAPCP